MKKIILTAAFAIIWVTAMTAQSGFGITAGYTNGTQKISEDGTSFSSSESGFYAGFSFDVEATETLDVRSQFLYTNVSDLSFLQIPLRLKYTINESGFNIQAGPQFNIILDETLDEVRNFSFGLGAGLGYDISERVFVEANYALQLTNSFENNPNDVKFTTNFINVGLGYKFD